MKSKGYEDLMVSDICSHTIAGAIAFIIMVMMYFFIDFHKLFAMLIVSPVFWWGGDLLYILILKTWKPEDKVSALEGAILFNDSRNIRFLVRAKANIKFVDSWYINERANEKTKKLLADLAKNK